MGAKVTYVKLVCDSLGERDFEFEHANRLLSMRDNGGWHLPKDSEFQLVEGNGLERRTNKRKDKRAEEKECDKQGGIPSESN